MPFCYSKVQMQPRRIRKESKGKRRTTIERQRCDLSHAASIEVWHGGLRVRDLSFSEHI